jgi:DNA-binding MarR family transcriptional regulator
VSQSGENDKDVLQFFLEKIDTVPELEALLLFSQNRSNPWTISDLARRLYIDPEQTRSIVQGLSSKGFISENEPGSGSYRYLSKSTEQDALIERAEALYRRQIVRISTLIHSKPSRAVRDFAEAFRFTREKP